MAVVGVNDQWWVNWQGPWVLLSKIGLKLGYRLSSEVSWQHKNGIFLFCFVAKKQHYELGTVVHV